MSKQQQYRPSRRNWIKLWTNEWLTGTIRWQLSKDERSIWADLLCLAGTSRFPGIIASGYESDNASPLMGYPLHWLADQCGCDAEQMLPTIHKLQQQDRILITEKDSPNGQYRLFLIQITSWEKYQSEYQIKRQRRKYREPKRSDSEYPRNVRTNFRKSPLKTPTEEVEGEVEVEVEVEEKPLASLAGAVDLRGVKHRKDVDVSYRERKPIFQGQKPKRKPTSEMNEEEYDAEITRQLKEPRKS